MRAGIAPVERGIGKRIAAATVGCLLLGGCADETGPDAVALAYARARYASDAAGMYRLLSAEDRQVKDEQTFRREQDPPGGFALEVSQQLASFIEAAAAETTIRGERATVRLTLRLPNASAPEIAALAHEWDEERLNALSETERTQLRGRLHDLHRARQIPILEGEDTVTLVREAPGWRVFLGWAGGVRLRFAARTGDGMPVQVSLSPEESRLRPGDRLWVTVRVANRSGRDITARVGHRIEPEAQAHRLALLQCPLLLPVTLPAGESEEFRSEYLLLPDPSEQPPEFQVTYEFLPPTPGPEGKPRGGKAGAQP